MPDSDLRPAFLARLDAKPRRAEDPPHDADDELVAQGDAYAAVRGQRTALSIEFIPRDGDGFILYYADIAAFWIRRPDTILIEYRHLFTVRLRLQGFDLLKRLIRDQRITWIRECSPAEAKALPAAVTRIDILRHYPSREAGQAIGGVNLAETASA